MIKVCDKLFETLVMPTAFIVTIIWAFLSFTIYLPLMSLNWDLPLPSEELVRMLIELVRILNISTGFFSFTVTMFILSLLFWAGGVYLQSRDVEMKHLRWTADLKVISIVLLLAILAIMCFSTINVLIETVYVTEFILLIVALISFFTVTSPPFEKLIKKLEKLCPHRRQTNERKS